MVKILITPEQVRQVSAQFKQASQQSQEMVTRLQNQVNSLQPEWAGLTKERFYQEFTQWQATMRQFVDLLNGIGQQLDAIAQKFETVDRS
ncbi:MAG: WXG100 family type VII secretion target [Bacillota bacterium]|nr:WXG100 family type VII secretion target [Bacillota bacterium]